MSEEVGKSEDASGGLRCNEGLGGDSFKKQLDHLTQKFQTALGHGANEHAWHPGEHWALAVLRGLQERDRYREALENIKAAVLNMEYGPEECTSIATIEVSRVLDA